MVLRSPSPSPSPPGRGEPPADALGPLSAISARSAAGIDCELRLFLPLLGERAGVRESFLLISRPRWSPQHGGNRLGSSQCPVECVDPSDGGTLALTLTLSPGERELPADGFGPPSAISAKSAAGIHCRLRLFLPLLGERAGVRESLLLISRPRGSSQHGGNRLGSSLRPVE